VRSAGTSPKAKRTVSAKDIEWADLIFVMEETHKDQIRKRFSDPCRYAKIHVLDIPDEYHYADPELMDLIRVSTAHLIEV